MNIWSTTHVYKCPKLEKTERTVNIFLFKVLLPIKQISFNDTTVQERISNAHFFKTERISNVHVFKTERISNVNFFKTEKNKPVILLYIPYDEN